MPRFDMQPGVFVSFVLTVDSLHDPPAPARCHGESPMESFGPPINDGPDWFGRP
jgi:hypothetical protein